MYIFCRECYACGYVNWQTFDICISSKLTCLTCLDEHLNLSDYFDITFIVIVIVVAAIWSITSHRTTKTEIRIN